MQHFPLKKGWVITIAILVLFIVLNPGYSRFREFTGRMSASSTVLHRDANFLVFSIYSEYGQKYVGILLNFIKAPDWHSYSHRADIHSGFDSVSPPSPEIILPKGAKLITNNEDDICLDKSDSSDKFKGVIINAAVPCIWNKRENLIENGVYKYIYKNETDSTFSSMSLVIGTVLKETSDSDAKQLLTKEGLMIMTQGAGEMVSTNHLNIDGVEGGEIERKTVKTTEDGHTVHFHAIQNYFLINRKMILIQYAIVATTEKAADKSLIKFRNLMRQTTFH